MHEHLMPVGTIVITRGSCTGQLSFEYKGANHLDASQRQDSLHDQLIDLEQLAIKIGCYDAADFLLRKRRTK